MTRKTRILLAVVLAYTAIEVAGYLMWPTTGSRCAPLPDGTTACSVANPRR